MWRPDRISRNKKCSQLNEKQLNAKVKQWTRKLKKRISALENRSEKLPF